MTGCRLQGTLFPSRSRKWGGHGPGNMALTLGSQSKILALLFSSKSIFERFSLYGSRNVSGSRNAARREGSGCGVWGVRCRYVAHKKVPPARTLQ